MILSTNSALVILRALTHFDTIRLMGSDGQYLQWIPAPLLAHLVKNGDAEAVGNREGDCVRRGRLRDGVHPATAIEAARRTISWQNSIASAGRIETTPRTTASKTTERQGLAYRHWRPDRWRRTAANHA